MNEEQTTNLEELVATNEQFKGARVTIDYAIALAVSFAENKNDLNKTMTDYVEKLYAEKYPNL